MHAPGTPLAGLMIAVLLAAACSRGPTAPLDEAAAALGGYAVTTGAASYVLEAGTVGWEGEIDFVLTNRSDRTISLLNCHGGFGLRLEIWTGQEWQSAWDPVLLQCLSPPIEIPPGGTLERVLRVFGGFPEGNHYPRFAREEIDGTYRLVITAAYWNYSHDGPSWGEIPPLEHRVSNTFEIRAVGR